MCTLIGKKFSGIGWVGVKNRDRSLPTHTELLRDESGQNNFERVTLVDSNTRWSEGMNSYGVSIISSSLTPSLYGSENHISRDGLIIREALSEKNVKNAVESLRKSMVYGCVMVFDRDTMWLIEGKNDGSEWDAREIKKDWVARTNHGVWVKSAGYSQDLKNPILQQRRISSRARLLIADYIASSAKTPDEIVVDLAKTWSSNPQLTTTRHPLPPIETRTTEQLLLIPSNLTMMVRNLDGTLEFNQREANPRGSHVLVGIV
jgi:hypothetical protein